MRLLHVAAQTTRIDLKVDLAVTQVMKVYKRTVWSSATVDVVPGAATTNRIAVAAVVRKEIVACFGIPGVSAVFVQELIKNTYWDDFGNGIGVLFAEAVSVVGVLGTVACFGIPVFLASGPINAAILVPTTTRLFLMLAADVLLVLTRAYKDATNQSLRHPDKAGVEAAAVSYRPHVKRVHKEVKKIVPKANMFKSFQIAKIKVAFEKVLERNRMIVLDEGAKGEAKRDVVDDDDGEDSDATEVDPGAELIKDWEDKLSVS